MLLPAARRNETYYFVTRIYMHLFITIVYLAVSIVSIYYVTYVDKYIFIVT